MDEVWLRVGVIGGALLLAVAAAAWRRSLAVRAPREVSDTGLAPGTYLLTASTCPSCGAARARLEGAVGRESFLEITWEESPGVFAALGIDAVPALLVVDASGDGRLHPGAPARWAGLGDP